MCTAITAWAHPTQFHTAAHGVFYLESERITLEQGKLPSRTPAETDVIINELRNEDWKTGWLLEINGSALPRQQVNDYSISAKSQSIELSIRLTAKFSKIPDRIRVSNSNLMDTHALFSNTLWIQSDGPFRIVESKPSLQNGTGKEANLRGIWTMKTSSRELQLRLNKESSLMQRLHTWMTYQNPWIQPVVTKKDSAWHAWEHQRTHPFLSVLLGALSLLVAIMGSIKVERSPKLIWIAPLTFIIILILNMVWWLPQTEMHYVGFGFLCTALILCAPQMQPMRLFLAPLIILGVSWLYGAPRLAYIGLGALIGLSLSAPSAPQHLQRRLHQLTTALIICVTLLGVWRLL